MRLSISSSFMVPDSNSSPEIAIQCQILAEMAHFRNPIAARFGYCPATDNPTTERENGWPQGQPKAKP
ncbi:MULTISPECIES: hypothetical protein [unclassified Mesorhizobium]|uniref:hypothetical protein n=1 Tax=unclassified Mesorhizobium TaxID=325217 RepID=UPI000FDAEC04|nr:MULTISPECIES: hypothetical protein [unclassified Mesorhizobium]TGQ12450.1 hypothetical protein EN862_016375 [Mesorhizobium sp. M2E.F.Ca.ET.219.01.1.1]TGT68272.1 hypothetical protein EN809_027645 [Mesorhizobium sp. M2E.F.Ca.ET.166.01.1.1]TGW01275.1 hypothetical protein EN797_012955 [Mesorhizobium sp. M2E.F.Ca.ET.154.01.1.1]